MAKELDTRMQKVVISSPPWKERQSSIGLSGGTAPLKHADS